MVYLFMNSFQLFLASFFRVFFNWFFMSLYCLSFLGLQLLIYFLFVCRWLITKSVYCIDYACRVLGASFKTGQCSFSPFLITIQIFFSLWLISSKIANEFCLFNNKQISFRSQSCYLIKLRKLFILSFLITYLLLFSCTLMSRFSYIKIGIWFKESAYSSLRVHLSNL